MVLIKIYQKIYKDADLYINSSHTMSTSIIDAINFNLPISALQRWNREITLF